MLAEKRVAGNQSPDTAGRYRNRIKGQKAGDQKSIEVRSPVLRDPSMARTTPANRRPS